MANASHSAAYAARINKAFDYIESNLDRPMTLEELAASAGFSKYHFNRIFMAMTGESPFRFINRLRLERAASLLVADSRSNISEIAWRCGFSDLAVFSRNFKKRFGISATRYRGESCHNSNSGQTGRNAEQAPGKPVPYFCFESQTFQWKSNMKMIRSVEVKELPKMTVAYIRYTGPYQGNVNLFGDLWNKLFAWAGPRGLLAGEFKMMIVYHDDPNITNEDKLRLSVCITVPAGTKTDGETGRMDLEGGLCAVGRFNVGAEEFQQAWEWMYGQWLPQSGYQPDDRPSLEMYPEEPKDGRFTVDICVPVRPL